MKVFGTDDQTQACIEILEKGELQISDKERAAQMDSIFKEVSTIIAGKYNYLVMTEIRIANQVHVSEKCVNPENKRPYPTSIISKALKDVHFSAKLNKSAKQQVNSLSAMKSYLKFDYYRRCVTTHIAF